MEEHIPTEAELRAFVVTRGDQYWRRWCWYIERDTRRAGTLWPPFFFNWIWFLYRRMYRELWAPIAMIVVVVLIQVAAELAVELHRGVPYTTPREIGTLINFGLAAATSWVGSFLYLKKFRAAVIAARGAGGTPEATLEFLRRSGGTSRLAAGLGIVVTLLMLLVVSAAG